MIVTVCGAQVSARLVIWEISRITGVATERILSRDKTLPAAFSRQLALWYLKCRMGAAQGTLARYFGLSWGAVTYSVQMIQFRLDHPTVADKGLPRVIDFLDAQMVRKIEVAA